MQGKSRGQYPFLKVGDISRSVRSGNLEIDSADNYVDPIDLKELRAKPLPAGTIIFAKIGEGISQNFRAITLRESLIDNNVMGAIHDPNKVDLKFLFSFLRTVDFYGLADKTSVPSIRKSTLERVPVPLPSMAEQRRIAAILDKAEDLRAKRRAAVFQLNKIESSLFHECFGDPVTNEKGWPRQTLANLLQNIDSGWSPTCLDRPAVGDEWGVLKLGAVTRNEYDDLQQKALPSGFQPRPELEVQPGDLLFTRKNTYDLVAACALVRQTRPRLMLSDLIFRLRIKADARIDPVFLHRLLVTPSKRREIQSLAGGSAGSMPNISKTKLSGVLIELPSLETQLAFRERVLMLNLIRSKQHDALTQIDAFYSSLQYRAFRGEL
jgi:type I restriction enzyme S subunit